MLLIILTHVSSVHNTKFSEGVSYFSSSSSSHVFVFILAVLKGSLYDERQNIEILFVQNLFTNKSIKHLWKIK